MSAKLYQPLQSLNFSNNKCFLTGGALTSSEEKISVFPAWLMSRYDLQDQPFKLLDESMATYKDLKIPCAAHVNEQYLEPLEAEVAAAFDGGFDGVKAIEPMRLFQWAGKLLYGIIFNELQAAIRQSHAQGDDFNMSQSIIHKFGNLHMMLQSLNLPLVFEEFRPFSLFLFKVNNPENEFAYRDEVNTLTFSIRLKDFGLIISLQDNGANRKYHNQILQKIEGNTLHPIQFEEFCGRVFYSAYLFNRLPEYNVLSVGDEIYIEAMSLKGMSMKPLFDDWIGKTYGQVLENFWKRWGFLLFEIIKNPERPMSFLVDKEDNFIPAESIALGL
jgi:hypothetical protein